MKTEYKVGMWVTFSGVVGSYGIVVCVKREKITVEWKDEFYIRKSSCIYSLDSSSVYEDVKPLPPVIAAFYESC